jgi:hypothetical protein
MTLRRVLAVDVVGVKLKEAIDFKRGTTIVRVLTKELGFGRMERNQNVGFD